jgi:anaerobic ribonucleoside-triphosphate reductase
MGSGSSCEVNKDIDMNEKVVEKPKPQSIKNDAVPCEVYSRVVGYYRPVQAWNPGKQEEFKDRKEYTVKKIQEDLEKDDLGINE